MKKYFYLQIKRVIKIFPHILAVAIAMLVGLTAILFGVLTMFDNREDNKHYTVAIAGDTDNDYISWGIAALQMADETGFSIDFVEMTESEAHKELKKGNIVAYVVLPEDFVEKAIYGDVESITYVTSAGMEGIASIFKKEITAFVTDVVVYSQKGIYGIEEALVANGMGDEAYKHVYKISLDYIDLIIDRNELYSVNELGVADGLSTPEYYICSIFVILFVLIGIPFSVIYIKRDYAFNRLLLSRGYSCGKQLVCEYGAHLTAMFLLSEVILLVSVIMVGNMTLAQVLGSFAIKIIPIIVMISAFNILMFELSNNLVSGLLLHFFVVISLCYVSGCMYPIYAFPKVVENIAGFLPTGMARSYLATCFTFDSSIYGFVGLILYAVVFYALALLLRFRKTVGNRGWLV